MREIKFRAWDNDEERMVYFKSLSIETRLGILSLEASSDTLGNVASQFSDLMQFTGLKDKNGKEIYEGDIVSYFNSYSQEQREEVYWRDDAAFYIPGRAYPVNYSMEVIGNIYENPDLISKER